MLGVRRFGFSSVFPPIYSITLGISLKLFFSPWTPFLHLKKYPVDKVLGEAVSEDEIRAQNLIFLLLLLSHACSCQ